MDKVFHNGTIITMTESSSRRSLPEEGRAEAMAIRDGKILAVGTIEHVRARTGERCEVVDLDGRTVVPGFNDSHAHLIETGEHLGEPDLSGLKIDEIAERLKECSHELPPNSVIVCGGVERGAIPYPEVEALDKYFPSSPVVLFHHSGHSAWFNRKAFESIGLSEVLGKEGELYLVAADAAGNPVGHVADPYECPPVKRFLRARQCERTHAIAALDKSVKAYHAAGITSAQDNTWYPDAYSIIQEQVRHLSVTNWAYGLDPSSLPEMLRRRRTARDGASENFQIGPVKFFIDGAFGTHSAWLWEPYRNDGENCGTGLTSSEIIRRIERYVASGRQLAFHVLGDRAVSELCDALELLERRYPWIPELRIRFEHAQLVREEDFPRLKRLGIVISAQPAASGDFLSDLQNIGERRAMRAYAHRSIIEHKIPLAFGSDFPWEESYRPLEGMNTLSRRPSPERIDPFEMLRCYTAGSAYAQFQEERKGTLEPGKDADFVVLNRNPLHLGAYAGEIEVEMTVVRGNMVYEKETIPSLA